MSPAPVPRTPGWAGEVLRCPLCRGDMALEGQSCRCAAGHNYDLSASGYLNLVLNRGRAKGYDAESFRRRRRFLEAGGYQHLVQALREALGRQSGILVDAGCGEGSMGMAVRPPGARLIGLDNVKESVQLAARQHPGALWLVADLANMPLKDGVADVLLNLFAPANYGEFRRVLRPGGRLLKLVPGPNHLKELRAAASGMLKAQAPEGDAVARHFESRFALHSRRMLGETLPLSAESLEDLLLMTPLLFGADRQRIDREGITHITIEAELLVGSA